MRRLLLVAAAALVLTGCGSGGGGSGGRSGGAAPPASAPAGAGVTYMVKGYSFPALTVSPGTTVTVMDGDDEPHTVTAEDGSFDTGSFDPKKPGTFVAPSKPGTYKITCKVHPSMHGTIVVR